MTSSNVILDFFNNYSAAIQAVAAILNLLLIGVLTAKTYKLQKKLMLTEQFYKLQEETILCINLFNSNISYFENKANTNSLYLRQLFDLNAGAGEDEDIAKLSLEKFNAVVLNLKTIKNLLDEFSINQVDNNSDTSKIQKKFQQIVRIKYLILNNNPAVLFESSMYGADSHWVEEERLFDTAILEIEQIIQKLEFAVKALS